MQTTSQSLTNAAVPATTPAPQLDSAAVPVDTQPAATATPVAPQPASPPKPAPAAKPVVVAKPASQPAPAAQPQALPASAPGPTSVPLTEDGYPNINVVPTQTGAPLMPAEERDRIISELEAMRSGQSEPKPNDAETKALAAQAETHGADALKKIEKCSEEGAEQKYPECAASAE